ncbi:MAG TPA: hypothetical protein DET40_12605 [Lentisphaeria bacterium]|nr:MAG: hypothetical protein A2X45_20695 [Lentisphaerae bacterium GWF2_50_93]HCE44380.1 hypothetical protein [Lentisphaeria bacterium]
MKNELIADAIRDEIVTGKYTPESKLPIRKELMKLHDASKGTVQVAISQLIKEGFLESRGVMGMRVCENPPHLSRYGIAVPYNKEANDSSWDNFWSIFMRSAGQFKSKNEVDFKYYYGLLDDEKNVSEQIFEDMDKRRIAGLVLLGHQRLPDNLFRKFYSTSTLIFSFEEFNNSNLKQIWFDYYSLIRKSVEYLVGKGRKKIALITNTEMPSEYIVSFSKNVKEFGAISHPEWIQGVCLCKLGLPWTVNATRLLFSENQKSLPDGIIILNENLTGYVMQALSDKHIIAGKDVEVVSHCNFPSRGIPPYNVKRIGFSSEDCLLKVIEMFSPEVKNKIPLKRAQIEPVWENHID